MTTGREASRSTDRQASGRRHEDQPPRQILCPICEARFYYGVEVDWHVHQRHQGGAR